MDTFFKNWFTSSLPGLALSLEVEKTLYKEKSQYQEIVVFQSKSYGRVLILDGVIQLTERDEFSYHEMVMHIPLFSHPNPKNVLVVGGGDGGSVREAIKHSCVEQIHLCELDEKVIEASKRYLPQLSCGFSDPRVQVHIQDAAEFLPEHKQMFDIIINDSTDPMDEQGPIDDLFDEPYYAKMKDALRPGGIICAQVGCSWTDMDFAKEIMEFSQKLFPVTRYAYTTIPAYEYGTCAFILASLSSDTVFEKPLRVLNEAEVENMGLKYYNSDVHRAAFVLPQFAKKALYQPKQDAIDNDQKVEGTQRPVD